MGDAGWENRFVVQDGFVRGLILGREERFWLIACWAAATGRQIDDVMKDHDQHARRDAEEFATRQQEYEVKLERGESITIGTGFEPNEDPIIPRPEE